MITGHVCLLMANRASALPHAGLAGRRKASAILEPGALPVRMTDRAASRPLRDPSLRSGWQTALHRAVCHFFMRLRTIGAEAAASAASSAATNLARRRLSMPSHSFVSLPIVFFEAAPAS